MESLLYRDTTDFHTACRTVLKTGEWMGELQQFARDGRAIIVEGRWTLLTDENGQPKNILAINTDITEHRQLQQQFLRAQRLESIGTLAGGIAHDLNNVLAPISMSIELLRSEVTSERGRELLSTLAGSCVFSHTRRRISPYWCSIPVPTTTTLATARAARASRSTCASSASMYRCRRLRSSGAARR